MLLWRFNPVVKFGKCYIAEHERFSTVVTSPLGPPSIQRMFFSHMQLQEPYTWDRMRDCLFVHVYTLKLTDQFLHSILCFLPYPYTKAFIKQKVLACLLLSHIHMRIYILILELATTCKLFLSALSGQLSTKNHWCIAHIQPNKW